jgi:hypothetical protein
MELIVKKGLTITLPRPVAGRTFTIRNLSDEPITIVQPPAEEREINPMTLSYIYSFVSIVLLIFLSAGMLIAKAVPFNIDWILIPTLVIASFTFIFGWIISHMTE